MGRGYPPVFAATAALLPGHHRINGSDLKDLAALYLPQEGHRFSGIYLELNST
jgi:hypothetical protein